jgi:hypothetical protein
MVLLRIAPVVMLLTLTALQPPQPDLWGRLSGAVSRVRDVPAPNPDHKVRLSGFAARMDKDISTIRTQTKGDLHPTFRDSLQLDAEALEDVTRGQSPIERILSICGAVANDLAVKAGYVVGRGGQSGPVAVETWTHKGNGVRQGYDVMYTPSAHPDRTAGSFHGVSSPTRTPSIAAGEYWMWCSRDGASGDRKLVPIGVDGKTTDKVVVQVPRSHP